MVIKDGKHQLVGFVELGENHDHMEYLTGDFFQPKKQMVNCHTMLRTLIPLTIYTMKVNPELHKKSKYIQPTWQVWGESTFLVEIFL